MISKNKELLKTTINVDNTGYNIKNNYLVKVLEPIRKEIAIEKK